MIPEYILLVKRERKDFFFFLFFSFFLATPHGLWDLHLRPVRARSPNHWTSREFPPPQPLVKRERKITLTNKVLMTSSHPSPMKLVCSIHLPTGLGSYKHRDQRFCTSELLAFGAGSFLVVGGLGAILCAEGCSAASQGPTH